jgi:hypothetical protein
LLFGAWLIQRHDAAFIYHVEAVSYDSDTSDADTILLNFSEELREVTEILSEGRWNVSNTKHYTIEKTVGWHLILFSCFCVELTREGVEFNPRPS